MYAALLRFLHLPCDLPFEDFVLRCDDLSVLPAGCTAFLLLVLLFFGMRCAPSDCYVCRRTMEDLLAHNARVHHALAPLCAWPRPLLAEPLDSGPWMTARQPIQFAAAHGLLLDEASSEVISSDCLLGEDGTGNAESVYRTGQRSARFDAEAARGVFEQQFGPLYTGPQSLSPYLRALACAFICFGLERKEEAQGILAVMNRSFRPPVSPRPLRFSLRPPFVLWPRKGRAGYSLKVPDCEGMLQDFLARPDIGAWVAPHNQYAHLFVYSLYVFARRKGVLCTSDFIWLKPVNRVLFYLLNNYGRRTVWVECAGPWTHYQAESALAGKCPGFSGTMLPCERKMVDEAVRGLHRALHDEGWVTEECLWTTKDCTD